MDQLDESTNPPLTEGPQTHHGSRPREAGWLICICASDQEYQVDDNYRPHRCYHLKSVWQKHSPGSRAACWADAMSKSWTRRRWCQGGQRYEPAWKRRRPSQLYEPRQPANKLKWVERTTTSTNPFLSKVKGCAEQM